MRLLLIGAPGAGKGTQGVRLAERFDLTHISSGDLLRQHVVDQDSLGRAVAHYLRRGDLVPDDLVIDMLRTPLTTARDTGGYVLDGFPRTVEQAKTAYLVTRELGVHVQVAVFLDVGREELVRRLLARGRGSDDTQEVIEHRLAVFEERTRPMLDYYANRETVIRVDGAQPPDTVTADLVKGLEAVRDQLAG